MISVFVPVVIPGGELVVCREGMDATDSERSPKGINATGGCSMDAVEPILTLRGLYVLISVG